MPAHAFFEKRAILNAVVIFPESIAKGSSGKVAALCTAQLHRGCIE